jgi:hypothetical protein
VVDLLRGYVPVLHCEVGGMLPANHKVVYVPQSCTLVQFDLVKDVMHFYANLALPLNTSSDRKRYAGWAARVGSREVERKASSQP